MQIRYVYYDIYVLYVYYVVVRVPPSPHLPRKILKAKGEEQILACKIFHPKELEVKIFIRKDLAQQFGQTRRELGLKDRKCTLATLVADNCSDTGYRLLATGHSCPNTTVCEARRRLTSEIQQVNLRR